MLIRRAVAGDVAAIKVCVSASLNATYGGLWTSEPLVPDDEDWTNAWIACSTETVIGVGLSDRDAVSDLWVHPEAQGQSAGTALLAVLEREIAERGFAIGRLRCFEPNHEARAFYTARGWVEVRVYPHEAIPLHTVDMEKPLTSKAS